MKIKNIACFIADVSLTQANPPGRIFQCNQHQTPKAHRFWLSLTFTKYQACPIMQITHRLTSLNEESKLRNRATYLPIQVFCDVYMYEYKTPENKEIIDCLLTKHIY